MKIWMLKKSCAALIFCLISQAAIASCPDFKKDYSSYFDSWSSSHGVVIYRHHDQIVTLKEEEEIPHLEFQLVEISHNFLTLSDLSSPNDVVRVLPKDDSGKQCYYRFQLTVL